MDKITNLSTGGKTRIEVGGERLPPKRDDDEENPHETGIKTYARYYGNELAEREIYKEKPAFPVGAVIVREKLLKAEDTTPELVTVMIKREAGFNKKNGDWEYLVVDGVLGKILKRERKGDCAACHANAAATDFVFKSYLK